MRLCVLEVAHIGSNGNYMNYNVENGVTVQGQVEGSGLEGSGLEEGSLEEGSCLDDNHTRVQYNRREGTKLEADNTGYSQTEHMRSRHCDFVGHNFQREDSPYRMFHVAYRF